MLSLSRISSLNKGLSNIFKDLEESQKHKELTPITLNHKDTWHQQGPIIC